MFRRALLRPDLLSFWHWPTKRKVLFVAKTSAVVGTTAFTAYYWPEITFVGATLNRGIRTASALLACTIDYKRNFPFEDELPKPLSEMSEEERQVVRLKRSEVNFRGAERLLALFRKNGGIYIKIGQHISALEHVLPLEYSTTMAILQDKAPVSSMGDVAAVFREDMKMGMDDIFEEFQETPIGAASLAQVHVAKLRSNGQLVAVKVQHHRLQAFVDMDMLMVSSAVKIVKRVFPQFEFGWLADEMRTNLPKELDFIAEAHNSERITRNLERTWPINCPVYIPKVFWEHTSKRVLIMEYCPGPKVTDVGWMKANAVDPKFVLDSITRLYAQMIFLHGFVHCDPHPGNILVQKYSGNSYGCRLVLLDHGIYKELPDDFRLTYARLWKALVDGNAEGIRKFATQLGGGDAYKLFSTVLTHRSWETMTHQKDWDKPRNPIDVETFRERASEYLPLVADLLNKLPKPLLLLLKTNDLLRAIDRALQTPNVPSKTFLIMGQYCVEAINDERWRRARGSITKELKAIISNGLDELSFALTRALFRVYSVLVYFKQTYLYA